MTNENQLLKKIISHCKEYGYIFPSSEIYDGLSATYDYGPYGVELKNNIKQYWWKSMVHVGNYLGYYLSSNTTIDPFADSSQRIVSK